MKEIQTHAQLELIPGPSLKCARVGDGPGISLLLLMVAARPGPQWEETGPKKGIMTRRIDNPVILINHWRWLEANGYKQQAASFKQQA